MPSGPEEALAQVVGELTRLGKRFALVGGLAVSVRAEVRFTRDVDLVVGVRDDDEMEQLAFDLRTAGYDLVALVEHETRGRLATMRLASPSGIVVDLISATSGIEEEIVGRATLVGFGEVGEVPVASPEDLLAMKVLSMTEERLQDRLDAISLLEVNGDLDLDLVRASLELVKRRGFHRNQDLLAKLEALLGAGTPP